MEDSLITDNTKETAITSQMDTQSEALPKKKAELFQQEPQEITREQLSIGKRLLDWHTIVPLVIVIVGIAYFAQKSIDPHKTWNALRSANMLFFFAAFVAYYASFPLRAVRWRILLQNVGYNKANGVELPKFWKLVEIIYISFFANVIVPAKLGDLYRAYLLRQETGLPTTRSFGTVLAERLLDLIVLLLLSVVAVMVSLHESLPPVIRLGLVFTLALVVIGIIGLFLLRIFRERIEKLVPMRFRTHYNHFQEGMLGSFRHLPTLSVLTVAVWSCESLRFYFVVLSINLITGSFIHVLTAALFIALIEALLTAIPFTGGGVGLVEGGMFALIALFNPITPATTSLGAAAIILDRSISLVSILVIGFIVFMFAFGRQAAKQRKKA
jgi:glycosyltransferase 2 family protein